MDFVQIAMFIGGGSLVATLLTNILKRSLKSLNERYGALATQALLFVISLAIAGLVTASPFVPTMWLQVAGAIFAGAMVIYEVLYKAVWQQMIQGKTE